MKQAPVLTDRDVKRMLQHFTRTAYPARNRCVFMLGSLAGMRIGEIAALKIGDVLTPEGAVNGGVKSCHRAAQNQATLDLGMTRATRRRPVSRAPQIAGG